MGIAVSADNSVCSMIRISGFGEGYKSGYSRDAGLGNYGVYHHSLKSFLSTLRQKIYQYDDNVSNENNRFSRQGVVFCAVTDLQPVAKKLLAEFGGWTVATSDNMAKYSHEVHIHTMPVRDFVDRFNAFAREFHLTPLDVPPRLSQDYVLPDAGDDTDDDDD